MIRIQARRRKNESKATQFIIRGRPVPQEKINRFSKRWKISAGQALEVPGNLQGNSTTPYPIHVCSILL